MKSKHFTELRKKVKRYDVVFTTELFGFDGWNYISDKFKYFITVVAKNPRQACERAQKRGFGLHKSIGTSTTTQWAHWRVKESDKSEHFKSVLYY